jgi:hypothetical protein
MVAGFRNGTGAIASLLSASLRSCAAFDITKARALKAGRCSRAVKDPVPGQVRNITATREKTSIATVTSIKLWGAIPSPVPKQEVGIAGITPQ